ncbi:alpha/beta fold hydrolase [Nocardioides sp. 31GB23]|uniref:alpha/beta hydrolase family protein n=1 Tax=Nocardioides sp. 31GB23 TaxID=3156065 RepID=UPI0032AEA1EB
MRPHHPHRPLAYAVAGVMALTLLLGACTGSPEPTAPSSSSSGPSSLPTAQPPEPDQKTEPTETAPTTTAPGATLAPEELPRVDHPVSLPALMREEVRAGAIERTGRLGGTERWTGHAVTYTVDGATVSGELLVPTGEGPFPALVLNHGYIDPAVYTLGRGMSREQEWFASNGFVVLHTDYRGHAGSDPVGEVGRETRLVYTRDAIGAVRALEQEPYVDTERLGMVGRSMGGGVTYNALVAVPDLVDAAVVFAPVSSSFVDNLRQFTEPNRPEGAQAFYDRFGTPRESPGFYRALSSRTFFDRVRAPVLIHHGTADDTCPPAWSRRPQTLLRRAGADSTLVEWQGEGHAFGPRFADSMRRTVRFLRSRLDV